MKKSKLISLVTLWENLLYKECIAHQKSIDQCLSKKKESDDSRKNNELMAEIDATMNIQLLIAKDINKLYSA